MFPIASATENSQSVVLGKADLAGSTHGEKIRPAILGRMT
jgi:hypothetical protein